MRKVLVSVAVTLMLIVVFSANASAATIKDPGDYGARVEAMGYNMTEVKALFLNPSAVSDLNTRVDTNIDTLLTKIKVGDTDRVFWSGTEDPALDAIVQWLGSWLSHKGIFRPTL